MNKFKEVLKEGLDLMREAMEKNIANILNPTEENRVAAQTASKAFEDWSEKESEAFDYIDEMFV